jgi:hypothetical protein
MEGPAGHLAGLMEDLRVGPKVDRLVAPMVDHLVGHLVALMEGLMVDHLEDLMVDHLEDLRAGQKVGHLVAPRGFRESLRLILPRWILRFRILLIQTQPLIPPLVFR